MTIFADPSELRTNTRLPSNVQSKSVVLLGLEAVTGADLLITHQPVPDSLTDMAGDEWLESIIAQAWHGEEPREIGRIVEKSLPYVLKVLQFRNACKQGILMQRKTGRDLCSIIPHSHGAIILERMLAWCQECWLVAVDARIGLSKRGTLSVNGKSTNYKWQQLSGATDAWQRRGGLTAWIPKDGLVLDWLLRQEEYLLTRGEDKVIEVRKPLQKVVAPDKDRGRQLAILAGLRYIGLDKARILLDYYGTLAGALVAVLDPGFVNWKDRPKGIGKRAVVENRRLFGLSEAWMRLSVTAKESND